jgi:hypothetical protein
MKDKKSKGSKVLERILKRLTPKRLAEMKEEYRRRREALTPDYQIGFWVGEQIINKYLPTLSIHGILTNKVIYMTASERDNYDKLNDEWFSHSDYGDKNKELYDKCWEILTAERLRLEEKYMPKEVKCYMHPINYKDEAQFKDGLISSLWNCDTCSYSLKPENIKIEQDDDMYFTIITLKYEK